MLQTAELLSNIDLQFMCETLKINIKAITFKDLYHFVKPGNGCYIINLDDSTSGKYGTHWTGLYINNKTAIYYDAFGLAIPQAIKKFITKNKVSKTFFSIDQIQSINSTTCGYYVLYFLYFMNVLYPKSVNYKYLLNRHNAMYSLENKYLNNKILQQLIKNIFKL